MMDFTLKIDHELQIIRYKHSGKLRVEDIGMAWDQLTQMEAFTQQGYHLLSDYSEASYNFTMDNIQVIIDILSQMPFLKNKKQAIITKDPYSTAGTLIFEKEVYHQIGFKVKTFSTQKAALDWLCND